MGKRIVVVDDDRDFRELLTEALTSSGYEVSAIPNGLRLMAALKIDAPDLLLLDVRMAWIDGYALCRALKQHEDYREIPVVFLSAKDSVSDIKEGLACGAVDYLTKPFDLSSLLGTIERHLGPTP